MDRDGYHVTQLIISEPKLIAYEKKVQEIFNPKTEESLEALLLQSIPSNCFKNAKNTENYVTPRKANAKRPTAKTSTVRGVKRCKRSDSFTNVLNKETNSDGDSQDSPYNINIICVGKIKLMAPVPPVKDVQPYNTDQDVKPPPPPATNTSTRVLRNRVAKNANNSTMVNNKQDSFSTPVRAKRNVLKKPSENVTNVNSTEKIARTPRNNTLAQEQKSKEILVRSVEKQKKAEANRKALLEKRVKEQRERSLERVQRLKKVLDKPAKTVEDMRTNINLAQNSAIKKKTITKPPGTPSGSGLIPKHQRIKFQSIEKQKQMAITKPLPLKSTIVKQSPPRTVDEQPMQIDSQPPSIPQRENLISEAAVVMSPILGPKLNKTFVINETTTRQTDEPDNGIKLHSTAIMGDNKPNETFCAPKKFPALTTSYQMTPPPRMRSVATYDISAYIDSDEENDHLQNVTKKPIPSWARGTAFTEALRSQFSDPVALREKERKLFAPLMSFFPINLEEMDLPVDERYAMRGSSICWNDGNNTDLDRSWYRYQ